VKFPFAKMKFALAVLACLLISVEVNFLHAFSHAICEIYLTLCRYLTRKAATNVRNYLLCPHKLRVTSIFWHTVGSEMVEIDGKRYWFDMQNIVMIYLRAGNSSETTLNSHTLVDGLGNCPMDLRDLPQHDPD
jgi:hypothetical protein